MYPLRKQVNKYERDFQILQMPNVLRMENLL